MKNSFYILFLLFISGCVIRKVDDSIKVFPPSKDAMIVRQARYISNTASELNFEVDVYQLKGYDYGHLVSPIYFFNNLDIFPGESDTTYFNFPSTGKFILKGSARADGVSTVPSTSILLVDESGSYDTLDHFNSRSQGINKLSQDFSSPAQVMLGGFSQNGNLGTSPVEFFQSSFTPYNKSLSPFIFDLARRTGGTSNLYDAVNAALDHLIANGSAPKNIIVLAHSNDESSSATLDNLIAKAIANQIQIHIIFRGQAADANPLSKLTEATNGTFVVCPSVGEMMCAFENLYLVLLAADQVYRLKVKYIPASGTISSGQEFWFTIKTHDTYFDIDNNPIVAYIKVP